MAKPTVRESMERILRDRGYDKGVDDDIFEELLEELEEAVHVHKGDF